MANITVTKSGNSIIVDFGDYSSFIGRDKSSYNASDITEVQLRTSESCVAVSMHGDGDWLLTHSSGSGLFTVDTIDGIPPTSLSDLFDKITALR